MVAFNISRFILVLALISSITRHIFCQHCPVPAQFNLYHLNKRLFGSGYAVTTTANYSLHKCARTCARYGWCRSFNYREGYGLCEMNSINASEASVHNLLTDTDWDYYDIDKWIELISASCTASTCPENHRCLPGGSSPWCIKIEDSIPDTCPDEYYPFNGTCYTLAFDTMTTDNPMPNPCLNENANLAKVMTEEINEFLLSIKIVEKARLSRIDTDATTYDVFYKPTTSTTYGYTSAQNTSTWIWLHDLGLDIKRRSSIVMNINSCTSASLALSPITEGIENDSYMIDLLYKPADGIATRIHISKYNSGAWNLQSTSDLGHYLQTCNWDSGNRIWVSWYGKILRLGKGDAVGVDELINEEVQEDFSYLAVSRTEVANEYMFKDFSDSYTIVKGPDVACLRLHGNTLTSPIVCTASQTRKYMCEKPAMTKIDGV